MIINSVEQVASIHREDYTLVIATETMVGTRSQDMGIVLTEHPQLYLHRVKRVFFQTRDIV